MEILQKTPHFLFHMATVPLPQQVSTLSLLQAWLLTAGDWYEMILVSTNQ